MPFILLAFINTMLIVSVVKSSSRAKIGTTSFSSVPLNKRKSMTISIIVFTLAFVVLTGPLAIFGGYFLSNFLATLEGRAIMYR